MSSSTIAGVFASQNAAEQARDALVRDGLPLSRITLSLSISEDGLTAEYPGQSFENQPGQETGYRRAHPATWAGQAARQFAASARYHEAVRSGGCLMSVEVESGAQRERVERLMRAQGARYLGKAS